MKRRRLDDRRPSERITFSYNNVQCSVLVGLRLHKAGRSKRRLARSPEGYWLAELGDVFIDAGKVGSDLEAIAQTGALLLSLYLQHGGDIRACRRSIPRHPDGRATDVIGAAIDAIVETYYSGMRQ